MYSNIGTPKTINFPFGTNGKYMVFGVPKHTHFRVVEFAKSIDPDEGLIMNHLSWMYLVALYVWNCHWMKADMHFVICIFGAEIKAQSVSCIQNNLFCSRTSLPYLLGYKTGFLSSLE